MKYTYFDVLRSINSYWIHELSSKEFIVLVFIVERTIRYKKYSENIPMSIFLNGVFERKSGKCLHAPLPISRTSIKSAYNSLFERGLISITTNDYGVNKFEVDCNSIVEKGRYLALQLENNHKVKSELGRKSTTRRTNSDTRGADIRKGRSNSDPLITDNKYIDNKTKIKRSDTTNNVVSFSYHNKHSSKSRNRSRKRVRHTTNEDSDNYQLTKERFITTWKDLLNKYYDTVTVNNFSDRDFFILNKSRKQHKLPMSFNGFTEWVIENWSTINYRLSWIKSMTKYPSPFHYARYFKHIVKVYADLEAKNDIRTMQKDENSILKKFERLTSENIKTENKLKESVKEYGQLQRENTLLKNQLSQVQEKRLYTGRSLDKTKTALFQARKELAEFKGTDDLDGDEYELPASYDESEENIK